MQADDLSTEEGYTYSSHGGSRRQYLQDRSEKMGKKAREERAALRAATRFNYSDDHCQTEGGDEDEGEFESTGGSGREFARQKVIKVNARSRRQAAELQASIASSASATYHYIPKLKDLFKGVVAYYNKGADLPFTSEMDHETCGVLKMEPDVCRDLIMLHGGLCEVMQGLSGTTHIICEQVPDTKGRALRRADGTISQRGGKWVHPDWVRESLRYGRRLSEDLFPPKGLETDLGTTKITGFFASSSPRLSSTSVTVNTVETQYRKKSKTASNDGLMASSTQLQRPWPSTQDCRSTYSEADDNLGAVIRREKNDTYITRGTDTSPRFFGAIVVRLSSAANSSAVGKLLLGAAAASVSMTSNSHMRESEAQSAIFSHPRSSLVTFYELGFADDSRAVVKRRTEAALRALRGAVAKARLSGVQACDMGFGAHPFFARNEARRKVTESKQVRDLPGMSYAFLQILANLGVGPTTTQEELFAVLDRQASAIAMSSLPSNASSEPSAGAPTSAIEQALAALVDCPQRAKMLSTYHEAMKQKSAGAMNHGLHETAYEHHIASESHSSVPPQDTRNFQPESLSQMDPNALAAIPEELRNELREQFPAHRTMAAPGDHIDQDVDVRSSNIDDSRLVTSVDSARNWESFHQGSKKHSNGITIAENLQLQQFVQKNSDFGPLKEMDEELKKDLIRQIRSSSRYHAPLFSSSSLFRNNNGRRRNIQQTYKSVEETRDRKICRNLYRPDVSDARGTSKVTNLIEHNNNDAAVFIAREAQKKLIKALPFAAYTSWSRICPLLQKWLSEKKKEVLHFVSQLKPEKSSKVATKAMEELDDDVDRVVLASSKSIIPMGNSNEEENSAEDEEEPGMTQDPEAEAEAAAQACICGLDDETTEYFTAFVCRLVTGANEDMTVSSAYNASSNQSTSFQNLHSAASALRMLRRHVIDSSTFFHSSSISSSSAATGCRTPSFSRSCPCERYPRIVLAVQEVVGASLGDPAFVLHDVDLQTPKK